MDRVILLALMALILVSCGREDGGPADPSGDDQTYVLFFGEVIDNGEEWWGYPPPETYCVAIAPGSAGPDLDKSRDPTIAVLEGLRKAHPHKEFYSYSTCTGYPFEAPSGEAAGLLWVAPLEEADRATVSGGWSAQGDWTEWSCTFGETGGTIEVDQCSLLSET